MHPLARYGPPVAWMGVIAFLSSDLFAAEQTGAWLLPLLQHLLPGADPALLPGVHAAIRKLGHLVEYGILAALWRRALAPSPRAGAGALGLATLYAALDEARRGLTVSRTPSVLDVVIDGAGALLAVACLEGRGTLARVGLVLGRGVAIALALASLAAAALDWSLGFEVRDLLVAALGGVAGAWALARLEARVRRRS